ncbi:MAG TPA: hypothetical protein VN688_13495 [Gemmataceae bacterium]|nr:hypothetical protein [Gemmataceae bacterium]
MRYNEFEEQLLRTLLEYLILTGQREIAAAAADGTIEFQWSEDGSRSGLYLDLPPFGYNFIARNKELQQVTSLALRSVSSGHLTDKDGVSLVDYPIDFRMKLVEAKDGWRDAVKEMILKYKGSNQGFVTQLLAARNGRPVITYNELKYASQSEVKIAIELETRKVLFFPLAVGVRADTGEAWQDHREVDFLICHDGVWGILEIAYHPNRFEQDAEKMAWFKKAGILCIEHRTAEKCYNDPIAVIDEFLVILAKHKR